MATTTKPTIDRDAFRQRVAAGLNPAEACGCCGSGNVKVEGHAQYCEDCLDWEANGVIVDCLSCGSTYRVIRRQGCQKDGEEREQSHRDATAYRAERVRLAAERQAATAVAQR